MNNISIFQYQSGIHFFKDAITELKRTSADFSIRKFCKSINFGSHTLLVMILNGSRRLTLKQVPALSDGLGLSHEERLYFQTLVQLDSASSEEERNLCKLWLNDLNPRKEYRILEVDQYHVIADWIHMAILTLAKIDGAKITPENIYQITNQKVPIPKIREAIERLFELDLIKEDNGNIIPTYHSVKTKNDISSKGAREYHKQVSRLAIESIEEQSPDIREFQSFALTVPLHNIGLAKDLIRKFRHQFVQLMEAVPGDSVYQCNIQFFQLAVCPSSETKVTLAEINSSESSTSIV